MFIHQGAPLVTSQRCNSFFVVFNLLPTQNPMYFRFTLLSIIPHPNPTFQLGSRQLVSYMNMRRNCHKNSSRPGSAAPTNPPTGPPVIFDLLSKKYKVWCYWVDYGQGLGLGIELGFRATVRVSINIKLLVLHLIYSYIYIWQVVLLGAGTGSPSVPATAAGTGYTTEN